MSLHVHFLALQAVTELRRVVQKVQRRDRASSSQLRDALSSMALNIGEAEYSDLGAKRARLHMAAASANESRSVLAVAVAWAYVAPEEMRGGLALLDRVLAMLFRLLRSDSTKMSARRSVRAMRASTPRRRRHGKRGTPRRRTSIPQGKNKPTLAVLSEGGLALELG